MFIILHHVSDDTEEAEDEEAPDEEAPDQAEGIEQRQTVGADGQTDTAVCMICHTSPPTTVLLPCKHFGLCDDCCATRQRLQEEPANAEDVAYDRVIDHSICPIDRRHIEQYVRVVYT